MTTSSKAAALDLARFKGSTPGFVQYLSIVQERLDEAIGQNGPVINEVADLITAAQLRGRPLFVFGATHAGLLAQDLYYRAGGLARVEPILPAGLMLNERPVTRTTLLERMPGFGELLLDDVALKPDDVVLVISVSGRNPVTTELAAAARERGAQVIALTSLTYSKAVTPRGSARLFEIAQHVIDLPGSIGDAAVTIDGSSAPVGPTSTAVGSAILHGLIVEVARRIVQRGHQPEILTSGNLDNGDQDNSKFLAEKNG
ncbi:sugar isomerase domain-containing protein [Kribbella kalugense]|uniref:Putative phosphosugar-binding protein n=1 Tax=Kribbella kalugense TaxID=2512221 RepID=A0A4R8A3N3_9ACTN|nr:sugar isomerase domain-containing protein [Kribbella kalugense]TDW24251.1 putative phosphosugar-binding protein [Kribbella kalugense]